MLTPGREDSFARLKRRSAWNPRGVLAMATTATLATLKKKVFKNINSKVTPEGWPWWPWWPSTIGRESRRPTANPMLMRGYLCASASVGADSACLAGYHMGRDHTAHLRALVQTSDAAARANAGVWLGLGAHPSGLGVHNAHNSPCPKPEVCPAHRRTTVKLDTYRLRSVRKPTRRPGTAERCGTASGRTRAASACTTHATRLARSRKLQVPWAAP
eukprot:scaffold48783_cov70-Phaeocystis_antarctica.AAC.4